MLMSGNDAALAIAGECGGQESFVAAMNDKALELGLANTHFDNPNGLDSENHHTTARELAKLTLSLIHIFPANRAGISEHASCQP